MLSLAAAPVTLDTFPAPTTPLTITLTNQGNGPAHNITLQLDSGLLTLPISQTLGTLEAGQSLTTTPTPGTYRLRSGPTQPAPDHRRH